MGKVFLQFVNLSINAGYIMLAIILLRSVFRKMPRCFIVAMWGLAAIRLLCPISFESSLSLLPSSETLSPEVVMSDTPSINSGISVIDKMVNPVLSESFTEDKANIRTDSSPNIQSIVTICTAVWTVGIIVILLYGAISYICIKRKVADSFPYKENIRFSENIQSPFILGIIKPEIYIPYKMDENIMRYVIFHEKSHLKRYDHIFKLLSFILLALHWFNPLVWISYILFCRDIELACDENVIRNMNMYTRQAYAEALLECSIKKHRPAVCPLAFGEIGVKERVINIMNYKKTTFWVTVTAVAIFVVVAVCLLTNPADSTAQIDNNTELGFESYSEMNKSLSEQCNSLYIYEGSDKLLQYAYIELYDNNIFTFTYSMLSSYLSTGKYNIEDSKLILSTDDKKYTYVFNIVGDTLIFDASKSSEMPSFSPPNTETVACVPDGAVFMLNKNTEK